MMSLIMKAVYLTVLLSGMFQFALAAENYDIKQIEYETEDGWTISGTLRLPAGAGSNNEYPGLVLLHELEHDRNDFADDNETGLAQRLPTNHEIATLVIDWRGRDRSMGEDQPMDLEVHEFSTKTQDKMYLDVIGAMEFMGAYEGVDSFRLGIVASHFSAEHAVRAMQETEIPTQVLVLLSGLNLSDKSKEYLGRIETPIYVAASISDRPVFLDMAEVFARSKNLNSYMVAPWSAGRGHNVLRHADDPINRLGGDESTIEGLDKWLVRELRNIGRIQAVSMTTRDGWTIHGNLRYPDDLGKNGELYPGVVLVSGARSHRYSMYRFEEEMARRGFVVLSVELRGRGQSMGGKTIDTPEMREIRENLLASPFELDTMSAIDFLATQKGVDPDRIGIVGQARGTRSALLAAKGDPRIKTMILISVYEPDSEMEQAISQMDFPILLIDGETNWAAGGTRHIYKFAKRGQLMLYPGLGHSHHILEHNPQMANFMGDFMERELP
jgi:dienelactone hydrolase